MHQLTGRDGRTSSGPTFRSRRCCDCEEPVNPEAVWPPRVDVRAGFASGWWGRPSAGQGPALVASWRCARRSLGKGEGMY